MQVETLPRHWHGVENHGTCGALETTAAKKHESSMHKAHCNMSNVPELFEYNVIA